MARLVWRKVFDALSATQLTGVPCWSVCGATQLHQIELPEDVTSVLHLFPDNDDAGRKAVERAKQSYGYLPIQIAWPPDDCKDWNDFLRRDKNER